MSFSGAVPTALLSVALFVPSAEAQEASRTSSGMVGGQVVDQRTEDAVADVEITLATLGTDGSTPRTVVSNGEGRFLFQGVPGGSYLLSFRRLGYSERSDSVAMDPGTFLDLTVTLAEEAIELEDIVVTVGSVLLARQGFYDRKRQGFRGTFIEPADIEEEQAASVTELFQNVRGLTVVWGGVYGAQVFMNQRSSLRTNYPGCRPEIWLDGIRSTMESLDVMRVEELEGVEIYRGSAPGAWTDPCGTIAVWTKRVLR